MCGGSVSPNAYNTNAFTVIDKFYDVYELFFSVTCDLRERYMPGYVMCGSVSHLSRTPHIINHSSLQLA